MQVYEAQQKTMAAAGLLALTAPAIVEAIICPGVTIVEKVEVVEKTVVKDSEGRTITSFDGIGITALANQLGFKTTAKAWEWLESVGYGKASGHWLPEMDAHETLKLPRQLMKEIKRVWATGKGDRQKMMGELF